MLDYIIQILFFQTLFLAVYDLLLKRETFFQWNRAYLILTSLLAYIIPLVKFEKVQKIIPQEYIVQLPKVILSPTTTIEQTFDWSSILFTTLQYVFWIGIIVTSLLFIIKLYRILQLVSNNENEDKGNYRLVFLENDTAFSFFNYIFLGKTTAQHNKEQIIEHELVHVQQKHSLDLILFELQRIVCWFNPFSYLYQNRISELHEFIADSKAIKETDKTTYFNNLLAETFGVHNISFINLFFKHSLIKKRIVMLHKKQSKSLFKFKYLLLLPLLASMLIYSSCENEGLEKRKLNKQELEKYTVSSKNQETIPNFRTSKKYELLRNFLEENSDYLVWLSFTKDGRFLIEVHHENEIPPKTFIRTSQKFNTNNNANINMYVDFSKLKSSSRNYDDSDWIPFAVIKKSPIFPGCEDALDQKQCFQDKIKEHIQNNFDMSVATQLGLASDEKKVYVQFKIDKNGIITETRARGPHKALEREALKTIKGLPKMQPGEHNGKKVGVKYTIPVFLNTD
ncbi:MAG: M56 family metallopeptidase [Flavobacteriaceae bacterium]|nr:M56 family metallopeptidase [Flavobacteriaceae bacterium]